MREIDLRCSVLLAPGMRLPHVERQPVVWFVVMSPSRTLHFSPISSFIFLVPSWCSCLSLCIIGLPYRWVFCS